MRGTLSCPFLHAVVFITLLLPTIAQSDPVPPTAVIVSEDFEPMQEQWQPVPSAGSPIWSVIGGTYRTRGAGNQISVITSYRGVTSADPPTQTLNPDRYTFRVRMRNQGLEEMTRAGLAP